MKAKDKIYVPILPRTEHSIISEHCVGTAWDSKEHITIPNIEEYIRKDALLEWLKNEMKEWSSESNTAQGVKMGLTLVLDKIESL